MLIISSKVTFFLMGNCYFCKLLRKILKMKKIVFAVVVCLSLVLGACKQEPVVTKYTIGCMAYQYGSVEGSDWQAIEKYFKENVCFNESVEFESASLSENDAQARNYFQEQMAKIDIPYLSSLLKDPDFFVYGIATVNADGSYRTVASAKFTASGVSDYTE